MGTVLLIILLIISVIMTGLILIQQSEGGALGIGGGGGGFMSGRSAANSVSKMTGILGALFLMTCLALSVIMTKENNGPDLLQQAEEEGAAAAPAENSTENSGVVDDEALTNETDSGETTTPLANETEAVETGDTPEDMTDGSTAEPAETPEDE